MGLTCGKNASVVQNGGATVKIACRSTITRLRRRSRIISKFRFHVHIGLFCARTLFWAAIVVAILVSLAALVLRFAVLPNVERYQTDIISRAATSSGMDVSVGAIRGGWVGFHPYIEIENLVFLEPASSTSTLRPAGAVALKLPHVDASLSWWSLLLGQIRFAEVSLQAPELTLTRGKDGLIYFAGRALNQPKNGEDDSRLLNFLLEQPGLRVQRASLTWRDDLTAHDELRFTDVGLRIEKAGAFHHLGFVATPPRQLARAIEAAGDLRLDNSDGQWRVNGRLFATVSGADLSALREHIAVPDALQSGVGNVRVWVDIDNSAMAVIAPAAASVAPATVVSNGAATANTAPDARPSGAANDTLALFNPIRLITADLNLVNARAQLQADLAPLNLSRLAGRIEYQAREGGFSISSKGLEIRTRDGVVLPAADFSLTLQNLGDAARARGEISGNGVDLKVIAALLQYFPVGKEVREGVAGFGPRGVVRESVFTWTGPLEKPSSYRIKGALSDFGVNAVGRIPGVSKFSGTVEGDDKGGKFTVAARNVSLDVPNLFRAPLGFDTFDGDGAWQVTPEAVVVELARLSFTNADLTGEIAGRYSRLRSASDHAGTAISVEKQPGSLDIKGTFAHVKATSVGNYLPNGIAQTRDYLDWAIRGGEMTSATFQLKGDIYQFPFRHGKGGEFKSVAHLAKVDFRYAEGWPIINDIGAEMVFENTKFSVRSDRAQIFKTRLGVTSVLINDLAEQPQTLEISSSADARAEDVSRFLRESPLASSVGAFTRVVSLEGPGSLELALKIPLGSKGQVKVDGKYSVNRATAKTIFGPVISSLSGGVTFTENGVKSFAPTGTANALSGTAFGNPFSISINGGGSAGVTTEFSARADLAQLADVLPFKMPQQVAGTANFDGRILSRSGGTEVIIDSPLTGIASALPYPLAKRVDEARALRVQIVDTAQATERILVAVAGNAAAGGQAEALETRIEARFQRRFDSNGVPQGLFGGMAMVGMPAKDETIPAGLWLGGTLRQFDFDAWLKAFKDFYPPAQPAGADAPTPTGSGAVQIAGFDVKLDSLLAYGRPFGAMSLKGRQTSNEWQFNVDSAEAVGEFNWRPAAFDDRGEVRARLVKFVLNDESSPLTAPQPIVEAVREADFPALDIVADSFTQKDRWLGKLELRARPQGRDWKIDQLNISNGHVTLQMDGIWQRAVEPASSVDGTPTSRTTMNISLDSSNLNALLGQFGYGDQIRGGTGKLRGKLSWPGHVYQMKLVNLSGNFAIEANKGQFAKIEPGAGKLLGLMSLQSLPRRLTLDFRDLFSEGFAFDSIEGDFSIKDGIMFTDNFQLAGPAAGVRMTGDISLPAERQNLLVTVVPKLSEGVALSIGVATLNPAIALAALFGQKVLQGPVEKIFSFQLAVSGTWDNPQVERLAKGGAPVVLPPGAISPVPPVAPAPGADPAKSEPAVKATP